MESTGRESQAAEANVATTRAGSEGKVETCLAKDDQETIKGATWIHAVECCIWVKNFLKENKERN